MGRMETPTGFAGNGRYAVRRCLGGGSFGEVYEGYDRTQQAVVALKTLRRFGSASLYRLKQEFRSLSDIAHPNLVSLYELVGEDDRWFIAMEMVNGISFSQYVRGAEAPGPLSHSLANATDAGVDDPTTMVHRMQGQPPAVLIEDPERLRRSLVQLLSGVMALHGAGKLHRDIKPSNVLVTSEGRVVLLDFGLVYDTDRPASELSKVDRVLGTAAFLAPEYARDGIPSAAADMYSVGVLLFQGLTGRLPFDSLVSMSEFMASEKGARPSDWVSGIPEALDSLCADLMNREPRQRPSALEALLRLGADPSHLAVEARSRGRWPERIEGREMERRALDAAFRTAQNGRAVLCMVRGETGMGKTALVHHFLEGLRAREDITLLRGRCFERESVPFKAFDVMMDGLRRRIERFSHEERTKILPSDAWILSRLFPVLKEVFEDTEPTDSDVAVDPFERQQRAFDVCRRVLRNLARQKPLVVFLDDVQWGDADSAKMLVGWLHGLQRVRILIVVGYRSEDEKTSPFLARLKHDPIYARCEVRSVEVAPLSPERAAVVARGMIGDAVPRPAETAVRIAQESGGNPHLMAELVSALKVSTELGVLEERVPLGLDDLVRQRMRQLEEPAQRLLRFVSVADRPLPIRVLLAAAELGLDGSTALNQLRAARFVRTTQTPLGELVELYHSRVGRALRDSWTPEESGRHHGTLARAMEGEQWNDPEALMMHYLSAGEQDRAGELARTAATQAFETLAFARAANLFGTALELGHWDRTTAMELKGRLAKALVYAGRGEQAARLYLELAAEADEAESFVLRTRAAEQLITHGYLDEGRALLIRVLDRVDLRLPSTRFARLGHLLHRACIRWKGLSFRPVSSDAVADEELYRIDACWLTALSMSFVDPLLGLYFHERNLLYALRSGERYRVLRAFSMELAYRVQWGGHDRDAWNKLMVRTRTLAQQVGQAHGTGLVVMAEGMSAYLEGRFKGAYRHLRQAEKIFVEQCPGVTFELAQSRLFALRSQIYMGELKQVRVQQRTWVREALDCGNLLLSSSLRSDVFVLLALARDAPDEARDNLDSMDRQWDGAGAHYQNVFLMRGRVYLALYEGRGQEAWREVHRTWGSVRAAYLDRGLMTRVGLFDSRGAAALGLGREGLAAATAAARELEALGGHRMAAPLAQLLRGGIARLRGNLGEAAAGYERAMEGFAKVEMHLHRAVARRRLGELRDGAQGQLLIQAADGWFAHQGVQNSVNLCRAIAPVMR